jgi:hypothetical protein
MDYNGLKKNTGRDLAVQAKQATLNTFEILAPQINFAQILQWTKPAIYRSLQ